MWNPAIFSIIVVLIVCAYIYTAWRVNVALTLKSFGLYVLIVGLLSSYVAKWISSAIDHSSLLRIVVFWSIVVISEDLLRTYIVARANKKGNCVRQSAISFSIAASCLEIVVQTHDLFFYAVGVSTNNLILYDEYYEWFFSYEPAIASTLLLYVARPFIHYLLCILLFKLWESNRLLSYVLIITIHIAADVAIAVIALSEYENAESLVFVVSLLLIIVFSLTNIFLRSKFRSTAASGN